MTNCSIKDCYRLCSIRRNGKRSTQRGYCIFHYRRFKLGIDLEAPDPRAPRPAIVKGDVALIPLGINAKDGYTTVDKEFAYLADEHKFYLNNYGYVVTHQHSTLAWLHHFIVGKPSGRKMVVDHIDRNPLNNRKNNLRIVSQTINLLNREPLKSKYGYKGVYKTHNKFRAEITIDGQKHLGGKLFDTPEEAAIRYNELAKIYHKEYATFNVIRKRNT